jgi:hypothetical protein
MSQDGLKSDWIGRIFNQSLKRKWSSFEILKKKIVSTYLLYLSSLQKDYLSGLD